LSTAVGLAMGRKVPLWACDALYPRAVRVNGRDRVLAVLDARKGRVYAATYVGGERLGPIEDAVPEEVARAIEAGTRVTGEGAWVYRDLWEAAGGSVCEEAEHPAVDTLVRLTRDGLGRGEGRDPSDVHPLYVRRPDAQTMAERSAS
jgi:tRNA A37 threonylcarbamoyladenosine modification protein TsaB